MLIYNVNAILINFGRLLSGKTGDARVMRVIVDEVSGPWPDYRCRNISTACVLYCPCEAVSLSNVADCLKSKIPQDVPHPDPTKEPFSPWNSRKSPRTGDSTYVRAPACTSLTPTGAVASDSALLAATPARPWRRTLLLPSGACAGGAPLGNPPLLRLPCSPFLFSPRRGHAASWARQAGRRPSAPTRERASAARPRRLWRALKQACSAPSPTAAPTPARSARALERRLGSGASRSGVARRCGDRPRDPLGRHGSTRFPLARLREECSPSARGIPRHAEALGSANALLTVL